jgi:hypothetical protein
VQQRELSDAQEYLTGSFPLTVETPSAIALQVLNAVFYGLDLNELQTYRERVNMITVDDIQRVAQQYLHPDKLSIVLVGDASVFAKDLAGVGFDQVETIPIGELDLSSPGLRRRFPAGPGRMEPVAFRVAPPVVRTGKSANEEVRSLIARVVAAKGGVALLRSIQTVRTESVTTVAVDGIPMDLPTVSAIRYPASYRLETRTPKGPLVQVFNTGTYWFQDERGAHPAPPGIAEQIRGSVQRDLIPLLLALADGKITAALAGTANAGGRAAPALDVALPDAGPLTLIFDPATALVSKARYSVKAVPGPAVRVEETYSDYRDVNGLKVAFQMELRRDGAPSVKRTVRTFEVNVPLEDRLFIKPS